MPSLPFHQVDVFSPTPLKGNPVAVVAGADALTGAQMQAFANWTNLSETTFLLRPTQAGADYRVRIFTPWSELPFAGHPTLGSCHAWLATGGKPHGDTVIQECGAGLVPIRRDGGRLAFAAPPALRTGPLEDELTARLLAGLGLDADDILATQWCSNGPAWRVLMLRSRERLLAVKADPVALEGLFIGLVAPWDPARHGTEAQFEVRALIPGTVIPEDPVTGSLNASLAQWLIGAGLAPPSYVASQGTVLGREGRVHVNRVGADIWIGGDTVTCIAGEATL